ncbi:MAG: hypothetical protein QNK11_06655 [Legionella sp.]|nr:hypothetical protein [Legionella sp.]
MGRRSPHTTVIPRKEDITKKPIPAKLKYQLKNKSVVRNKNKLWVKKTYWDTVLKEKTERAREAAEEIILSNTKAYEPYSRSHEQLKTDYPNQTIFNATRALIQKLQTASVDYIDTNFLSILEPLVDIYPEHFSDLAEPLTLERAKVILSQTQLNSDDKIIQIRLLELIEIAETYIIKKDLHEQKTPEQVMRYLHPEFTMEYAAEEFLNLLKFDPEKPSNKNLSNLPGRGVSSIFTGHERIQVGKNYISTKNVISETNQLRRESAYILLTSDEIRVWSQLRINLREDIKLYLQSAQNIQGCYFRTPVSSTLKHSIDRNRHLVQDFSPAAAKKIAWEFTAHYPRIPNSLVALDPCAGWGDRTLGLASTGLFHTIIANDTNKNLTAAYPLMVNTLCPFQKGTVKATAFRAEELTLEALNLTEPVDFITTSIPYFGVENYAGDESSHRVYPNYKNWQEGFLNGFAYRMSALLKEEAYACIQVSDIGSTPLVKHTEEAFKANGFVLEDSMPYASPFLKSENNQQKKLPSFKQGETFLFFKKTTSLEADITKQGNRYNPAPHRHTASIAPAN